MAKELKFRKIFLNDSDIGGRFSALSLFGAVPAALVGVDLKEFFESAEKMVNECSCGGACCLSISEFVGLEISEESCSQPIKLNSITIEIKSYRRIIFFAACSISFCPKRKL